MPGVGPRLSAPEIQWRAEDEEEETAADAAPAAVETTEKGTMVDEPGKADDQDDPRDLNQDQMH